MEEYYVVVMDNGIVYRFSAEKVDWTVSTSGGILFILDKGDEENIVARFEKDRWSAVIESKYLA